jgi:hypothetical protein
MITKEMGKISAEERAEVENAIALQGLWLDMIQEANKDVKLGDGEYESVIVRDPFGVVDVRPRAVLSATLGAAVRPVILTKWEVGFGAGFKVGLEVGFLSFVQILPQSYQQLKLLRLCFPLS